MRRFLSPKVRFSAAELRYLTEVDGTTTSPTWRSRGDHAGRGRPLSCAPRPDTADMAIVVGDPWQGLGLGRRLARLLADARGRGGHDPDRGHDAGRQPPRAAADARRSGPGWSVDVDLARRARGRHSSGRLTVTVAQARPRRAPDGPWSEPPPLCQRAARRRSRRPRGAAAARARRRRLDVRGVPVQGAEALTAALQRRGVAGRALRRRGPEAVPSRKALALVRLADPHLPFIAVSPHMRPGDAVRRPARAARAACRRARLGQLPGVLTRELEQARMRRRVGGAHKLLGAQQAIADQLAAGLEPVALCERVLATLGDSLGWTPARSGARTARACAAPRVWHARRARAAGRRRSPTPTPSRPSPPARAWPARSGRSGARSGSRDLPGEACAPGWSPPPRSRSRSATSASA